jgi:outer membrane protein assembly factor BamB
MLDAAGVGGLTATSAMVVVSGRDATDTRDRFTALDPESGQRLWVYQYDAPAELDYGNSPRATPAIVDGVVVTLGATGILSGLDAQTGVALWSADVRRRFEAPLPTWGFSASPLVIDGVILLPLGNESPLVALDLLSGETRWRVAAGASAYASLMPIGENMIAGVSEDGYFLRRRDDGSSVWSYESEFSGDFGVPSPVVGQHGAIFSGENNGVLWFKDLLKERADQASAVDERLIPDSHTPVVVGDQLLVAHDGLHSLNLREALSESWSIAGDMITGYASIIASADRALVTTEGGKLLLVDLGDNPGKLLDQQMMTEDRHSLLSHPAILGDRLLVRVKSEVRCYRLPSDSDRATP